MKGWLRNNFNMLVRLSTNEADSGKQDTYLIMHVCEHTYMHLF